MKEKIIELKQNGSIPYVKAGKADSAEDFFNKVIKDQFANKDSIKATHKALMEYVNSDDAVFVLRLFGSDSKKIYTNLRRGFLSIYPDGHRMVFCDNTFAMPFATLKWLGKSYTTEELSRYMSDQTTRCGFGSTKEERELAYYNWNKNKANINLNSYGWYLAHIVPVGKYYSGSNLRDLFDNPKRSDWSPEKKIRQATKNLSEKELAMLKAHFLRMVHPLNSFLVPKRRLLAYDGNNIGEEFEIINRVQEYIKSEFPDEYEELKAIMQIPEMESDNYSITTITWSESESAIKKEKARLKTLRESRPKTQKPKAQKATTIDIDDFDPEEWLENTLRSIGKSAFIELYPFVKNNPEISVQEMCKHVPQYKKYSSDSKKSRLSSTKSIINQGLEREALINIAQSSHVDKTSRQKAEQLLSNLS